MADIIINPEEYGSVKTLVFFDQIMGASEIKTDFSAVSTAQVQFSVAGTETTISTNAEFDHLEGSVQLANNFTLGGVTFDLGSERHVMKSNGDIQKGLSPITGIGTKVGEITSAAGAIHLDSWTAGGTPVVTNWRGLAAPPINGPDTPFTSYGVFFRTAMAPLRPSSFSMLGTMQDATTFNVSADANGFINATRVKGKVDYETGVVQLFFCTPTAVGNQTTVDISHLGIPGVTTIYTDLVREETLRYNAVSYSYLPMDADLLGIDPVRLPTDGRVPIFRPGGFVVVGEEVVVTDTVSNGETVDLGQVRLSRVVVKDANGVTKTSGYTVDLEAGEVTFTSVSGWDQPVTVTGRFEDMRIVRDVQINGTLTFTSALSHAYSTDAYVSSALVPGTLYARVSLLFDQASWDGVTFSDAVSGGAAVGTYNDTLAPIEVTNAGASNERFALHFTNSTTFRVVGEHVGVIGVFNVNEDAAPINEATGEPYFTIRKEGWGSGWATGNILRINTVGALAPVWAVRTVQQGPNTGLQHSTTLLARGDVDRP